MLAAKFNLKSVRKLLFKNPTKYISTTEINKQNKHFKNSLKYDPNTQPEEFEKEYLEHHWLSKLKNKVLSVLHIGFITRFFQHDKDAEIGRYSWRSSGYRNTLANILYRSESLQKRSLMRLYINRFEHRYAIEVNKAEEPPKISPNSVFLYKDPHNRIINKRAFERYSVFLLLSLAWNMPTFLMYALMAFHVQLIQKVLATSVSMVIRMDLIPESEQLHVVKVGYGGFPKNYSVSVKDLVKISKEEENVCN